MDFILYWPKSNFGHLKCGYASHVTQCGTTPTVVANPIADGTDSVPSSVLVGENCGEEQVEATDTPSLAQTEAPGGSSATHQEISRWVAAVSLMMAMVLTNNV